jgi:hypothetical protein
MTTQKDTLASAMAKAFGEIDAAAKGVENPAFKRDGKALKYADINAVIDAIKPALINHGLFFTQRPEPHERGVQIETVLHHAGGETLSLGTLFVPADANNAQKFGSALTYARRYALVTAFGVPVEDDDGNAAAAPKPPALISDADYTLIIQLIEATSTDTKGFCNYFGVPAVKSLPADAFPKAKAMLEKKLAEAAKQDDTLADDAAFLGEGA